MFEQRFSNWTGRLSWPWSSAKRAKTSPKPRPWTTSLDSRWPTMSALEIGNSRRTAGSGYWGNPWMRSLQSVSRRPPHTRTYWSSPHFDATVSTEYFSTLYKWFNFAIYWSIACFISIKHFESGPAIVTRDEIEDPHNLRLQCLVNGVTKQDSNTNQVSSSSICWLVTRY